MPACGIQQVAIGSLRAPETATERREREQGSRAMSQQVLERRWRSLCLGVVVVLVEVAVVLEEALQRLRVKVHH